RRRTEEVEVRSRRRADAAQRAVGVIVLVLIVITQAMRPSMRDAAIFVLPALALLIDAVRPLPALPSLPPARSRVGLAALLLAAAVLVLTPRYGNADMLALILLGLAAGTTAWGSTDRLTAAWSQLPPTRRRPVRRWDRLGHRAGHPRPVGTQRLPDRGGHTAGHPHTALGQRRPGPLLRRLH